MSNRRSHSSQTKSSLCAGSERSGRSAKSGVFGLHVRVQLVPVGERFAAFLTRISPALVDVSRHSEFRPNDNYKDISVPAGVSPSAGRIDRRSFLVSDLDADEFAEDPPAALDDPIGVLPGGFRRRVVDVERRFVPDAPFDRLDH